MVENDNAEDVEVEAWCEWLSLGKASVKSCRLCAEGHDGSSGLSNSAPSRCKHEREKVTRHAFVRAEPPAELCRHAPQRNAAPFHPNHS